MVTLCQAPAGWDHQEFRELRRGIWGSPLRGFGGLTGPRRRWLASTPRSKVGVTTSSEKCQLFGKEHSQREEAWPGEHLGPSLLGCQSPAPMKAVVNPQAADVGGPSLWSPTVQIGWGGVIRGSLLQALYSGLTLHS